MKHLSDEAVVRIADDVADKADHLHLASCARCQQRVDSCRLALSALSEKASPLPDLPPSLYRWAKAYANTAAPTQSRFHLLDLLAGGAPLAAAVRGTGGSSHAALYGDDNYHLDVRISPSDTGQQLHGQVLDLDGGDQTGWRVAVVTTAGTTLLTDTDAKGEFWIEGIDEAPGLTVVAEKDQHRLVVPRVFVEQPSNHSPADEE